MVALVLIGACSGRGGGDTGLASAGTTSVGTSTSGGTSTAGDSSTTIGGATGTGATGSGTGATGASDTAGSTGSGGATAGGTVGPKFDVAAEFDVPPMDCVECSLSIASQQSGVIEVQGANVFATAELMNEIVYAMGTYGAGRFIASADSSLPFNEQTDCPITAWLAGSNAPNPPVLTFGWDGGDGPKNFSAPNETVVPSRHLPAQYIGNPAQLAADYDIVVYLEGSFQWDQGDEPTDAEMQTLLDYVQIQGGGLYAVSEFLGYMNQNDLDSVNRLMEPMGVKAMPVNLNWGNVAGMIDFTCFPAPAG